MLDGFSSHYSRDITLRKIYCTGCQTEVDARLTNGKEMYPHREDLFSLPFWICDACSAFVGTHHKTKDRLRPLGFLATKEIKQWRMKIHAVLDPLWENGKIKRGQAYAFISNRLGRTYHTGELRSVDDAKAVYTIVQALKEELDPGPWNK